MICQELRTIKQHDLRPPGVGPVQTAQTIVVVQGAPQQQVMYANPSLPGQPQQGYAQPQPYPQPYAQPAYPQAGQPPVSY